MLKLLLLWFRMSFMLRLALSSECGDDLSSFFESCSVGIGTACTQIYLLQQRLSELENQITTITTTTSAPSPIPATTNVQSTSPPTTSPVPVTTSAPQTSVPQYDMKYVVFNGKDCNIAGDFGIACTEFSNDGVLEVIRVSTGIYHIYWNEPYPDNNYVVITSSNGLGYSGAYSSIGGNEDALGNYYGVSRYFIRIDVRILGSSNSATDSDYIAVIAQPDFGLKYVGFYGNDCTGTGQYGTRCTELMNNGILEVVKTGSNIYEVYFESSLPNSNYLILTSSNVWGTSGAITNIVGNNDPLSTYFGISQSMVGITTRMVYNNAVATSDYVAFIAGIPETSASYPNMKWVTFDGGECSGSGTNGATCIIFGSSGVDEVVRVSSGAYKIYWTIHFNNNDYVLVCNSNVWGSSGSVCEIGGNNDATSAYYGVSTEFAGVETRIMNMNVNADSDYICVLAF